MSRYIAKRTLSTTARLLAKGDSSTIDYYKLPNANYIPVDNLPEVKIPILPDNYNTSIHDGVSSKLAEIQNKPTAKFNEPLISEVSDQGTTSIMADADILGTIKAGGPTKEIPTEFETNTETHDDSDKLVQFSENDKVTLWSIFGVVVAWWTIGNFLEKRSEKKH